MLMETVYHILLFYCKKLLPLMKMHGNRSAFGFTVTLAAHKMLQSQWEHVKAGKNPASLPKAKREQAGFRNQDAKGRIVTNTQNIRSFSFHKWNDRPGQKAVDMVDKSVYKTISCLNFTFFMCISCFFHTPVISIFGKTLCTVDKNRLFTFRLRPASAGAGTVAFSL